MQYVPYTLLPALPTLCLLEDARGVLELYAAQQLPQQIHRLRPQRAVGRFPRRSHHLRHQSRLNHGSLRARDRLGSARIGGSDRLAPRLLG